MWEGANVFFQWSHQLRLHAKRKLLWRRWASSRVFSGKKISLNENSRRNILINLVNLRYEKWLRVMNLHNGRLLRTMFIQHISSLFMIRGWALCKPKTRDEFTYYVVAFHSTISMRKRSPQKLYYEMIFMSNFRQRLSQVLCNNRIYPRRNVENFLWIRRRRKFPWIYIFIWMFIAV